MAAIHVRGEENGLADRISRYTWEYDDSDWMVVEKVYKAAERKSGRNFTLDGASDPLGTNSYLRRFCSRVDSYFDRNLTGESLFANPDYRLVSEYLQHFLRYWREAPETTSAVFILPVWESQPWWKYLKGAELLFWIERHSVLFTSPEWFAQSECERKPKRRLFRGTTNWEVMCVCFPCAMNNRGGKAGGDVGDGGRASASWGARDSMLRLSGEAWRDIPRMHKLPPFALSEL